MGIFDGFGGSQVKLDAPTALAAGMVESLPEVIDRADGERQKQHDGKELDHHPAQERADLAGLGVERGGQSRQLRAQIGAKQRAIGHELDRALGEFEEPARAELVPGVLDRIDSRELRRELGGGEDEASLRQHGEERAGARQHEPGQQAEREGGEKPAERRGPGTPGEDQRREPVGLVEQAHHQRSGLRKRARAEREGRDEKARMGARGVEIGRARKLALLARPVELVLRRLVALVALLLRLGHQRAPSGSARKAVSASAQRPSMAGASSIMSPSPAPVIAGAPTKTTMSCGMARLMIPRVRL